MIGAAAPTAAALAASPRKRLRESFKLILKRVLGPYNIWNLNDVYVLANTVFSLGTIILVQYYCRNAQIRKKVNRTRKGSR